jgi:putative ABC transport system substrate-binding protein
VNRREIITLLSGAAAAWPFATRAQQAAMPVVGILSTTGNQWLAAFQNGLGETGHVDGRNVAIDLRAAQQSRELPVLAAELVGRRVAVIAALGGLAAPAAKAAAKAAVPVVFCIGGDPVELGLVAGLNRPGGNITGVTFFASQLLQKQVGILHDLVPKAAVFGVLINSHNPRHDADARQVQDAARLLGHAVHVAKAGSEDELEAAFAGLVQHHVRALVIVGDALWLRIVAKLGALAERHGIVTMFASREFAEAGGLVTYGASLTDAARQAGVYAGRILKGEKAGRPRRAAAAPAARRRGDRVGPAVIIRLALTADELEQGEPLCEATSAAYLQTMRNRAVAGSDSDRQRTGDETP